MTNLSDERLSSLLDGELDDTHRRHAIDALGGDAEARDRWERFHLASDALHGNLPDAIDPQFASRVMAAIEEEPTILAPPPRKSSAATGRTHTPSRLSKRFAGLAVAASVAAIAVMGVESLYHEDPAAPLNQQVAENTAPPSEYIRLAKQSSPPRVATLASVNAPLATSPTDGPSLTARAEMFRAHPDIIRRIDPRLHKYLLNHSQQTARSNIQGVMPYARIVTYPGAQQRPVQR